MDRDAPSPTSPTDVVPPVAWETVRKVGVAGAGMAAAAAVLGLAAAALGESTPAAVSTVRLLLVFAGAVTAGFAVSLRPTLWQPWVIAAVAGAFGYFGIPGHWDSFRVFIVPVTAVAAVGAGLAAVPAAWRVRVFSAVIVAHFFGIFLATTIPNPYPWLVDQLYRRVYEPYLHFVYLRNAYHFYSPEPGPTSLLLCLLKTETGEEVGADGVKRKTYDTRWVVIPRRPADVRDPLGVTYYRRLSLTDQVSHATPDLMSAETFQKSDILTRRQLRAGSGSPAIPMHPLEADALEYRLPSPEITRYMLPSYARYLLLEYTPDAATAGKTTVKIYRAEHQTLTVQTFIGIPEMDVPRVDPYHPTTYRPYFLGEFGFVKDPADPTKPPRVELIDPQADMLYWVCPVVQPQLVGQRAPPGGKDYVDYMSVHAGREFDWSQLR